MVLYSHSRLSTFEQCPLKYKYQYIAGIKREEDSIEAFMGSRFHEVMEKAYAERAFRASSADDLKKLFNELWDKNWGDHVFVVRSDRTPEDYRKIGLKAVEDYHKRYAPFDEGRVLGIERRVIADLDGTGTYEIKGFVDRLMETEDGRYEIHDYKTSGTLQSQEYFDNDRQLALYEIAIRQMWPRDVRKVDLVWHYVVHDKEMRSSRTQEQLEDLKQDTIELIDRIEATQKFPPCESTLCRWCTFQDICPLFAHKFRTETLPTNDYLNEDGVALVNRLATHDARKRELKAELKQIEDDEEAIKAAAIALAEETGDRRLYGSDKQITIKKEIKVDYPRTKDERRAEFESVLKQRGLWERVSDFRWDQLRKMAVKDNWIDGVPDYLKSLVHVEFYKTAHLSRRKDTEEE
jgi:putative RecB family exonuclease